MSLADTLPNIEMFSELSKKELKNIAALMTPIQVKMGRVLTKEGDPGREFMIIIEGTATVKRKGRVLARLGPGDFFGTRQSGLPSLKVARLSDQDILRSARELAGRLLEEDPELEHSCHQALSREVARFMAQVGDEVS